MRFYLWATLAALALRLFFVARFPAVVDDSRLYANIAENWLHHGIYGISNSGAITPTLSRLPGYPAFLALIFAVFGNGDFRAVLLIQILFDLGTCFLIADLARRMFSERAAKAAFLLTALCPFLANYAAAALTETLEIFFTALALNLAVRALRVEGAYRLWVCCGLSIAGAILLRPDGGILLMAIAGYLLWQLLRGKLKARPAIAAAVLVILAAIAPLAPWTLRNLRTLHRFQPLAPRYANDSDELVMTGFNRWVKTWMADYVSVQEIYWNVPGDQIDVNRLPARAFDSPEQREETAQLFADYNADHDMTSELDARFAALASERIQAHPLRYYCWLPAVRIADMWLRPRTELLASDPRWWEFNDDPRWLAVSLAFGGINLAYVVMGVIGLIRSWRIKSHLILSQNTRSRALCGIGLLVFFLLVRSLFLGTLENPEPRYTLECFPVLILLASASFHRDE